jgi:hypothetical protein
MECWVIQFVFLEAADEYLIHSSGMSEWIPRSGNLYQLHAYLTNKAVETGWENVEGMLLYPSNGYRFNHAFTLHSRHRVRVCTVDLQQPWLMIETDLLGLLGSNDSSRAVGINHSPPSPAIPSLPAAPTPVVQAP